MLNLPYLYGDLSGSKYLFTLTKTRVYSTSRGREFNVVDFTEADRVDGGGGAVVAEPV